MASYSPEKNMLSFAHLFAHLWTSLRLKEPRNLSHRKLNRELFLYPKRQYHISILRRLKKHHVLPSQMLLSISAHPNAYLTLRIEARLADHSYILSYNFQIANNPNRLLWSNQSR